MQSFFHHVPPVLPTEKQLPDPSGPTGSIYARIYESPELGRSEVCKVFIAKNKNGELVAMKVYPLEWAKANKDYFSKQGTYLKEWGTEGSMPKLSLDPIQTKTFVYFPVELCTCGCLKDYVRHGAAFPVEVIQAVVKFLALTLDKLHKKGKVHGAINSSHVLVNMDPKGAISFKLTGFSKIHAADPKKPDAFYEDTREIGRLVYELATGYEHPILTPEFLAKFEKDPSFTSPKGITLGDEIMRLMKNLMLLKEGKPMEVAAVLSHPFMNIHPPTAPASHKLKETIMKYQKEHEDFKLDVTEKKDITSYGMKEILHESAGVRVRLCTKEGVLYELKIVKDTRCEGEIVQVLDELYMALQLKELHMMYEIFEYFIYNGELHILMEHCTGKNLHEYVMERITTKDGYKLKDSAIRTIVFCIATGLEGLTRAGVCMRDMRPTNILIAFNPDKPEEITGVKLCSTNGLKFEEGHYAFTAPELILKRVCVEDLEPKIGTRSSNPTAAEKVDVWSLGDLMHFICYGRPKYLIKDEFEKFCVDTEMIYTSNTDFPGPLMTMMKNCLMVSPADRPTFEVILRNAYLATCTVPVNRIRLYARGARIKTHSKDTEVYECMKGDKKFIMKINNFVNFHTSDGMKKIDREVSLLKELNSLKIPHVAKMYDQFMHNHMLYIIMEYTNGGDMETYLANRAARKVALTPKEQEIILINIMEPVHLMHERDVVHRDIHVSNILIQTDPGNENQVKEAMLGDFGFARLLNEGAGATNFTKLGNCACPELQDGSTGEKDFKKVDIWAIGMVIFNMLYGQSPESFYKGNELVDKKSAMRFPEEKGKLISPIVKAVMTQCFIKDPAKRKDSKELYKILKDRVKL